MPRPKGSKNKKNTPVSDTMESIEEKIAAAESTIEALSADLKTAKSELKELLRTRELIVKAEAEKKAAADKAAILAALESSGKSIEEILAFLK